MDQEIAVIHQDPFGVIVTFQTDRQFAYLLQPQLDLSTDRLMLPGVRPVADDEIVREARNRPEVKNRDVVGFLRLSRSDCGQPRIGCCWRRLDDFCGSVLLLTDSLWSSNDNRTTIYV